MLPLRIAARFIRTSAGQSLLITGGIAVGIAVQIFVGTLITSLQANLLETTIGSASHVTVANRDEKKPIVFSEGLAKVLRNDPRVALIVPVRSLSAIFTKGTDSAPVNIVGGEPARLDAIFKLKKNTVDGARPSAAGDVMLGRSFAKKYGLNVGDVVLMILPNGEQQKLKLVGIFDVGTSAVNDRIAFTTGDFPQRALGISAIEYSMIQTQLFDPFQSSQVLADWDHLKAFEGTKLTDWQVENRQLLAGLQSQSSSSYMIQGFVLVAVALGIASTLAISAVQKTRQIGILKAMGMSDSAAGLVFLWEAALLGGGGTLLGLLLGIGLLEAFQLAPVLFSIQFQPGFIAGSCGIGIGVSLLSAIIPYRRTSRLDPIEVIQGG